MLSQFTFRNYKSFREEALLDFTASSIQEHVSSLHQEDGENFLPVLCIYGPNGSGKSTVLDALNYLRNLILRPIHQVVSEEESEEIIVTSTFRQDVYHKFSPSGAETPVEFEVLLHTETLEVKYEISLLQGEIVLENLYYREFGEEEVHLAFERSHEKVDLGEIVEDLPVEKIKNTMPLLSHFSIHYEIEVMEEIVHWFSSMLVLDFNQVKSEKTLFLPREDKRKEKLFHLLKELDTGISDVRIERNDDGSIKESFMVHTLENGNQCEIPVRDESGGTKKLFSFLSKILVCLEKGDFVIADELDAKLHPKLLRHIIELFTNPESNENHAQLLFTSHDMTTMNKEVFRRDELWFCAKGVDSSSRLYSLKSIKKPNGNSPQNDEVYSKQYLEGHYGADPYIRRILDWGGEE